NFNGVGSQIYYYVICSGRFQEEPVWVAMTFSHINVLCIVIYHHIVTITGWSPVFLSKQSEGSVLCKGNITFPDFVALVCQCGYRFIPAPAVCSITCQVHTRFVRCSHF